MEIDFRELFVPDVMLLEMVLRGTITYLGLFAILRTFRSPTGRLGIADVLLITILADAAQNAMGGGYHSITSGFVLIATIVFWDRAIDLMSFRSARFARWIEPPPAILVKDGAVDQRQLRRFRISERELSSQLRQHGIDDVARVRRCFLEGDGHISVLTNDERQ